MALKLSFLTTLTMIAFAANSILCRMALTDTSNDPLSFTLIRLLSGALILAPLFFKGGLKNNFSFKPSFFFGALLLFSYALFFSLSYVNIDTGTGALILFACVQLTMIIAALIGGQKLNAKELTGFILALVGFVYLLLPGAAMPSIPAAILMMVSGVSWGLYSLLGKKGNPQFLTAKNFVLNVPLILILFALFPFKMSSHGIVLAIISGAVTSGMGYVLWYKVLKDLVTSTAAIVQLTVPSIAAAGGIVFLQEPISVRLVIASVLILGGIYIKVYKVKQS